MPLKRPARKARASRSHTSPGREPGDCPIQAPGASPGTAPYKPRARARGLREQKPPRLPCRLPPRLPPLGAWLCQLVGHVTVPQLALGASMPHRQWRAGLRSFPSRGCKGRLKKHGYPLPLSWLFTCGAVCRGCRGYSPPISGFVQEKRPASRRAAAAAAEPISLGGRHPLA